MFNIPEQYIQSGVTRHCLPFVKLQKRGKQTQKNICLKLPFHQNISPVSCSNDDFCLFPFMTAQTDLVCCVSELELSSI